MRISGAYEHMTVQKIAVYYSSTTGNTLKLAEHTAKVLEEGHKVVIKGVSEVKQLDEADLYILAFWCRRSGLDDASRALLGKCSSMKILAIGAMGGDVAGEYGARVERNVREAIGQRNICIGVFLCQGAVNMDSARKRMELPEDSPHYVSMEKYQRMLLTQGHPDEVDLKAAERYVLEHI